MANHAEHSEHMVSSSLYWLIWGILIVCTVLTAWIATIDLGPFNTVVALTIATFKATIVVLVFMHVKYTAEKMTKPLLIAAVFWLLLLLVLSLTDYSSRLEGQLRATPSTTSIQLS